MRVRRFFVALALLATLTCVPAFACQFTWTPPTTNVDGTPLTDLSGYKVYFTPQGSTTPNVAADVTAPATGTSIAGACQKGSYYATAYNKYGLESASSNVIA